MECRPYEPDRDGAELWRLKTEFERGLGSNTGDEEKRTAYDAKLTEAYGERYLDWVRWCLEREPRSVIVADPGGDGLAGYAFVLPERLAMIWDAAVLNELYVEPDHRGSGAANDLMEAALSIAREQDLPLDRLVLDVDPENGRARAFYDRHGFEPWGEMVAREL
ncbi:GNAT family N-acetyltransferase [Halalkalicoccus salilacus]|uniref:GNAT family N-acetyltransferase n=1 Tax=Halalkalicoccus salilacus TaxID=3117459 RepID=UPI00300F23DB